MGLDISAYRNIKFLANDDNEEAEEAADARIYANPDFPKHADGLADGYYSGECVIGFRAGSYSGYNRWREQLCDMVCGRRPEAVWSGEVAPAAFLELIHFSDCEGAIGPETSAKPGEGFRRPRGQGGAIRREPWANRGRVVHREVPRLAKSIRGRRG